MHKRAQHIAEYMVVFEVFAVATVVVITALGILPDIGWGTMVQSSDELLSIGPVGLLAQEIDECGGYSLHFRNNDDGPISIERIYLGDEPIFVSKKTLLAGMEEYVQGSTSYRSRDNGPYALPLRIAYRQEVLGAGLVNKSYDDPLYGTYARYVEIGSKANLHQHILYDYCLLSSKEDVPNHAKGSAHLKLDGAQFNEFPSGYSYASYNGGHGSLTMTNDILSSFTLESLLKVNYSTDERGIFYKPNSFFLTVKGNQLHFGVFSSGKAIVVSSPVLEDTWSVVHMVMDDELKLYVDGQLKQSISFSSMDASTYPLYVGTFTPDSGKHSVMSLGFLQFSSRAMIPQEIASRSTHLLALTAE